MRILVKISSTTVYMDQIWERYANLLSLFDPTTIHQDVGALLKCRQGARAVWLVLIIHKNSLV